MKIKKFRIKNYKSIIDSGDCYLENSLTIFAGKNESGKTSILEALFDFNTDVDIKNDTKPISKKDAIPEISIVFVMTSSEVEEFYNFHDVEYSEDDVREVEIEIIKTFPNEYKSYSEISDSLSDWDETILEYVPNFIFFKSFDDNWPNQVAFNQLPNHDFIEDLAAISDLDIELITSSDERSKRTHKRDLSLTINEEYSQFWKQDNTEINIDWDSNTLFFWIEEDGQNYRPSERSKGKQWHMSFYVKVTARTNETRDNIILIDEPGLFLHASAQNDVYKKIVALSSRSQILFTTHSPYLLNKDELHRIRLVFKKDTVNQGTIIENKIHALADKETLTPILTAIGLGLGDGIQNITQEKNIVVEGISDYFYLQGMKAVLGENSFNIISGGGAGNMGNVGTILRGWGGKVIYLYDNDKGARDGKKNLTKHWFVPKELIQTITDNAGAIEDMFSISDFKKNILNDKPTYKGSNSKYIKQRGLNKVILAKNFITLCQNSDVVFTQETTKKFQTLFTRLEDLFSNSVETKTLR